MPFWMKDGLSRFFWYTVLDGEIGERMMIRKLQNADMDRVAGIWLDANLRAHCFISPQYWKSNFAPVKEMLPRAEVYVYENDREIWGFIGLNGE